MKRQIGNAKARERSHSLRLKGGSGGALLSGRDGDWVFYVINGKQFRRRYVVPKDPRTPKQLAYRAALGKASKCWSHSSELTHAQRDEYRETAAGVQSRTRLGQSGPLTGQQYYVGGSCASFHQGLAQPKARADAHDSDCLADSSNGAQPAKGRDLRITARQCRGPQRLTQATWEIHRVRAVNRPCSRPFPGRFPRDCRVESPRKAAPVLSCRLHRTAFPGLQYAPPRSKCAAAAQA